MRTITIVIDDNTKKIDIIIGGQMTAIGAARMCYVAGRVLEEKAKLEKQMQPMGIQGKNDGDDPAL